MDHLKVCLWRGTHQDDLGGQEGLVFAHPTREPAAASSCPELPPHTACIAFTSSGGVKGCSGRETALLPLSLPASFPSPCPSALILLSAYILEQLPCHLLELNP